MHLYTERDPAVSFAAVLGNHAIKMPKVAMSVPASRSSEFMLAVALSV